MEGPMESFWSEMPPEILERVLSFVPVPSLCRFRTVCQEWKLLLCKPSFHDLCDLNGKKEAYLFVSRYLRSDEYEWCLIDPNFKRTMCFLDLDAGRWYAIKNGLSLLDVDGEGDTRVLAMDDGLVCELNCRYDTLSCTGLVISNPVTKTRRELPPPPIHWGNADDSPIMVPVVDKVARSFVIFLLHNSSETRKIGMHLYDSTTNEWCDLKNPPEELDVATALSAVFFRGALYAVFEASSSWFAKILLSYNLEENLWSEVSFPLTSQGNLSDPQLLVIGHRLIMMVWLIQSTSAEYNASFQVLQILTDENSSRVLFQMSRATLRHHFGEDIVSVTHGIPCIDSNGLCNSITMMSSSSGKLMTYDLVRGFGGVLPPHPLGQGPLEDILDPTGFPVHATYVGKPMNLRLRDVLSQDPAANGV